MDLQLKALKTIDKTLIRARSTFKLEQAKLDAERAQGSENSSDDDACEPTAHDGAPSPKRACRSSDSGASAAAANGSDKLLLAKRACRDAFVERDTLANEVLAVALAYYPEVLRQQRKRLMPKGLPTIVSQRSREDYDDIQTLIRAVEGRHTLLRATFDGAACVLKVVPVADGHCLAREAGTLKEVDHPNIIKLLAVFVENEYAYLHMPYASRGDLEQFLTVEAAAVTSAGAVLPVCQLQQLTRQLCEALAYLADC